jgi:hypothetical protein
MDVLAHRRTMAAFCRQRVAFENENDAFWIREAEAQSLLLLMAFCQRLGARPDRHRDGYLLQSSRLRLGLRG